MDSSFQVQNDQAFPAFGSYMPNNMQSYWESPETNMGELLKTPASSRKKDTSKTKNSAALRSHCEAERRRRERINGHLANLRTFLPCSDKVKMDKATLLAEVISQIKVLKKQAIEATKDLLVPTDANEVTVEPYDDGGGDDIADSLYAFRASICCEYKPELITDIRQAISDLKLTITKAEISTLEGRVKNLLIVTGCKEDIGHGKSEKFAKSIQDALCSVLQKMSVVEEYLPTTMLSNKRRKISCFEPSTSSPSL
ncbi:hypothetical protein BVRB_8g181760 [Beta vulgaris subsp. vulgaris]|nr:hypothetical protein BVRB_8g181760 [Beta vulgaris subsp. vulgaris]